jgi:hypothetical protein
MSERAERPEVTVPLPRRVLVGREAKIFDVLPASIITNLHHPTSESALVWNLIYPLAREGIDLSRLLSLRPLWGPPTKDPPEDHLEAYFWGYDIGGNRLPGLDDTLRRVDGSGPKTEVDLFFIGERNIIAVEAKYTGAPGRCSRYSHARCPEVHPDDSREPVCRYWEPSGPIFTRHLEFGPRPSDNGAPPLCYRHYQLGRTVLVGQDLAARRGLDLHLWLLIPEAEWRAVERAWLDFVGRLRDDRLWRNSRVISWDVIQNMRP